jgi:hypothetical protein
VYECVERVGREHGLRLDLRGTGSNWAGGDLAGQKVTYVVEASEEELPFLEHGSTLEIARFGEPDGRNVSTRKLKLDPETGELLAPEGVDLKGLKPTSLSLTFRMRSPEQEEPCDIEFRRDYGVEGIRVTISTRRKDGRTFCRDFLTSLDSKIKLALKLREAKKERRRDEKRRAPTRDKKG